MRADAIVQAFPQALGHLRIGGAGKTLSNYVQVW